MKKKKISYCTTCKGRLWQLKDTLPTNLDLIKDTDGVDLVLLNYHSDDGLDEYIGSGFKEYLDSGKLKYYSLVSEAKYFDMSYAKNIVHCLASGKVLFNLDADNFIGTTVEELKTLTNKQILTSKNIIGINTSRFGRIGIHASDFHALRGYNENIKNMGGDDGNLIIRALHKGFKLIQSQDMSIPIQQSIEIKTKYSNPVEVSNPVKNRGYINLRGYGIAEVEDLQGNRITTGRY